MTIYLICTSCIGTTIEDRSIVTPCLRWREKGYSFPDNCPKRARGLKIKRKPLWRRVPEENAINIANLNDFIGTKYRFFE